MARKRPPPPITLQSRVALLDGLITRLFTERARGTRLHGWICQRTPQIGEVQYKVVIHLDWRDIMQAGAGRFDHTQVFSYLHQMTEEALTRLLFNAVSYQYSRWSWNGTQWDFVPRIYG